jgi:hypothetical protein
MQLRHIRRIFGGGESNLDIGHKQNFRKSRADQVNDKVQGNPHNVPKRQLLAPDCRLSLAHVLYS